MAVSTLSAPSAGEQAAGNVLVKRLDGIYEERLGDIWTAQYSPEPATGLWQVEILKDDVLEWQTSGYTSIEEARQSAQEYYNQL